MIGILPYYISNILILQFSTYTSLQFRVLEHSWPIFSFSSFSSGCLTDINLCSKTTFSGCVERWQNICNDIFQRSLHMYQELLSLPSIDKVSLLAGAHCCCYVFPMLLKIPLEIKHYFICCQVTAGVVNCLETCSLCSQLVLQDGFNNVSWHISFITEM